MQSNRRPRRHADDQHPPPDERPRYRKAIMPHLLFRLTAAFAVTALLLASALTLMSGPVLAQDPPDDQQQAQQPADPQDDGTEESTDDSEVIDGNDQAPVSEDVFLLNEEFVVETYCPNGIAHPNLCDVETRYFVFDTMEEYYLFLQERTTWRHYRFDQNLPAADINYWRFFRHSREEWPSYTVQDGNAPTTVNLTDVPAFVPVTCQANVFACSLEERRFTFFKGVQQGYYFFEDLDEWIDARTESNTAVSHTFWRDKGYEYTLPPTPPYLANQEITVDTACDDGTDRDAACTAETRYFHFHTEAQYFDFLHQRGDWLMSRFAPSLEVSLSVDDGSDDDDASDDEAGAWLYWQAFDHRTEMEDDPIRDEAVSDTLSLEDVAIDVDTDCGSEAGHCVPVTYYFDFADNQAAIDFQLDRLAWLESELSGDDSVDADWWLTADYTTAPGEPAARQNVLITVDQRCSGIDARMICDSDAYYFNFATESDYLHFLKELGDNRMAQYDPNSSIASDDGIGHQFWRAFDPSPLARPWNTPAGDAVRGDFDLSAVQIVVPVDCVDNIKGCDGQLREFTFANSLTAANLLSARVDWLHGVLQQDDTADPNFWINYRSWEQNPPELQGLRLNNIPWCYDAAGEQICTEITRYFWHVDWRDRGDFQREHQAWQSGASTDWSFWMDYDWGYDATAIVNQDLLQNQRISVPVACTGPYSCVHAVKFINFTDWQQKGEFQALHEAQQNDGTQTTFYWLQFDTSDAPH